MLVLSDVCFLGGGLGTTDSFFLMLMCCGGFGDDVPGEGLVVEGAVNLCGSFGGGGAQGGDGIPGGENAQRPPSWRGINGSHYQRCPCAALILRSFHP